jgi:N-formylglutamate amidohydrolase
MDIRSGDRVARGGPQGGPKGGDDTAPGIRRYCLPGVLMRHEPGPEALAPVVVDSPHSGRDYPEDFGHAAPLDLLRRAEDAFVDELIADAPAEGAPLLAALFPRSYIDPNRHEADIDESLLAEPWPHGARPTGRSERGLGLLRRLLSPTLPIYDRALGVVEVERRLAGFYHPYHDALRSLLDAAHARFGAVWHVNFHSMKAMGRGRHSHPRADFVLGDLDGAACDRDFTALVKEILTGMGYTVRLNDPFKGAELVTRYSEPRAGRHSLQIEINRRLYLDEAAIAKTADFDALRADMRRLIAGVVRYARKSV